MEQEPTSPSSGMERRAFLKRSAIVAGATVWAAPTVQSLVSPAFATGTGRCPPGHTFRFKYDVGTGFDSGVPRGRGSTWCLPEGYTDVGTRPVNPNGCFTVENDTQCVHVQITPDGKTATVTLPAGAHIEDLQAKAGSWHNGECGDAAPVTGNTSTVTLQTKQISYVAGVFCYAPAPSAAPTSGSAST